MERDDLLEAWASLEAHLAKTQRLNELLLARSMTQRAQTTIQRDRRLLIFEIVVNYLGVVMLGSFVAAHIARPVEAMSGALLGVVLIVVNAMLIHLAIAIGRVDYEEPVIAIQTALERIKMRRARIVATILIAGPLLWPAMLVVGFSLVGVDALRVFGIGYLAANLAFGGIVAAGGLVFARTLGRRFMRSRWGRTAVDALSGDAYRRAAEFLDTIDRFQVA